jgi:serine/threonine protein kinase
LLLRDRYRALSAIAQGGFGKTFLAVDEDKPSKSRCIIKQFYPQAQGTSNLQKAAKLFAQEAERLEQLGKHPQIPELLAYFIQDNQQYLVQELIEGQNLAEILATNGAFTELQIRDLLTQLLPVLDFIHTNKIIHRDIKPTNIIRRSDGRLVLVDFGAAKLTKETTLMTTGTTIGSPEYVAPEQAMGRAVFASDLYSLGVTCIHLVTNVSPFELFEPSEEGWAWREYLAQNPISFDLARILDKMSAPETKKRFRSAAEVLQQLNPAKAIPRPANPMTVTQPPGGSFGGGSSGSEGIGGAWKCIYTFTGHGDSVNSVAFSPDGQLLTSGSSDGSIKLWHLRDGVEVTTLGGRRWFYRLFNSVTAVALSSDGQTLASGINRNIKLWHLNEERELTTLRGHPGTVEALAFSADGQMLASGGSDGTIKLWWVRDGQELRTFPAHHHALTSLAFTPDGKILASHSASDNVIKLWRLKDGQLISGMTFFLGLVLAIAFTVDGQAIACGSQDETLKIWRLTDGEELGMLRGNPSWVSAIAISPNGATIATGGRDKTIKIWQCD